MSTTINVTVDSGGLSEQNRQQVDANRQARLEQDRLLNLSAKALDERVAAQAAKGLSLDGQPLNGKLYTAPRPREEPAAFRLLPSDFGEGYFTITRGTNSIAVATVRSGNKEAALTVNLTGSEIPEGFRDRSGADKAPVPPGFPDPATQQPYLTITSGGKQIRHVGYRRDGAGYLRINAISYNSGGWAQFESVVRSADLIVLPVSANTAIFAYSEQRHSYKTYTYHEETFFRDGDNLGGVSIDESTTSQGRDDITKAAFLVSYNSVKQITYPEALYQTARQVTLIPPFYLAREDLSATGMQSFITWNDPPIVGLRQAYVGTGTEYSVGGTDYNFLQQAEIISWGLKSDDSLYERASSERVSPGIYDVLRGAAIPNYSYPDNPRFSDVQQQINARGQQFKWLRVKYKTAPDTNTAQIYKAALPEYYSVWAAYYPFLESGFVDKKLKGNRAILTKQVGEIYYRWTDWGEAGYCRSQAAAFGFSPAELTP